jgi:hypothetical protein
MFEGKKRLADATVKQSSTQALKHQILDRPSLTDGSWQLDASIGCQRAPGRACRGVRHGTWRAHASPEEQHFQPHSNIYKSRSAQFTRVQHTGPPRNTPSETSLLILQHAQREKEGEPRGTPTAATRTMIAPGASTRARLLLDMEIILE